MTIFLAILAVLLLIAFFPLAAEVRYNQRGLTVFLRTGPVWFRVYPRPKKSSASSPPLDPPSPRPHPAQKGGPLPPVRRLFPLLSPLLSAVKRRVTLHILRVHVRVGGADDPAAAALKFGGIHSFFGVFSAVMLENFKIKEQDLKCGIDFDSSETTFLLEAGATLRFWQLLFIVLPLFVRFMKILSEYDRSNPTTQEKR